MQENFGKWMGGIPDTFYAVSKLEKYVHYGTAKLYSKGSYIGFSGEGRSELFYVLNGKVQLNYIFDDGRERMVYFGGKHSVFGHLYHYAYKSTFEGCLLALEDSKVCHFSEEQIEHIFQLDRDIILDLLKNSNAKASYFMKQAVEMDYFNSAVRVVRLLHDLCISMGVPVDSHIEVSIKLTLKNISEITGAHYVTVSKVFTLLKRQDILVKKNGKMIIYNLEKLKELTQRTQIFKNL
ncbi:Crp/Fnr family transcriptional regulator [Dehalobacter sp. TBBPA1]|uniref:Crp/Fnr family transcriptional regulator n=1 Tax=Dehalobacter sp. TBBPA1 TaxID=3235037 RepID=UPI0034A5BDCB